MTATHAASLRPGRKPIKDWDAQSPEDAARLQSMMAKCAKNSQPKAEVMPTERIQRTSEPVGVASTENTLLWERTSPFEMTSTCDRYQVVKRFNEISLHDGTTIKGRSTYECWLRVQNTHYRRLGPIMGSFEAAKDVCEAHSRKPQ